MFHQRFLMTGLKNHALAEVGLPKFHDEKKSQNCFGALRIVHACSARLILSLVLETIRVSAAAKFHGIAAVERLEQRFHLLLLIECGLANSSNELLSAVPKQF